MLESIAYRLIVMALVGIENFAPHQNSEVGLCVPLGVKRLMEINPSTTESILGMLETITYRLIVAALVGTYLDLVRGKAEVQSWILKINMLLFTG